MNMETLSGRWDPSASEPANFDGHVGPIRQGMTKQIVEAVRIPDWLVEELEAHVEEWRTITQGYFCINCRAGFIRLTVLKPLVPGLSVAVMGTVTTYSFRA